MELSRSADETLIVTLSGTAELEAGAVALAAVQRDRRNYPRATRQHARELSVRLSQQEIDAGSDQEQATATLHGSETTLAVEGAQKALGDECLRRVMPLSVLLSVQRLAEAEETVSVQQS